MLLDTRVGTDDEEVICCLDSRCIFGCSRQRRCNTYWRETERNLSRGSLTENHRIPFKIEFSRSVTPTVDKNDPSDNPSDMSIRQIANKLCHTLASMLDQQHHLST
jgi:hypothetical protein